MRRAKVVDVVDDVLADGADAVIVDPPRSGCPKRVLSALIAHEVPRVIYVSCGTHALGRDIPQLVSQGYVITQVAYFDMFPHTPHAEVVVSLEFQGAP